MNFNAHFWVWKITWFDIWKVSIVLTNKHCENKQENTIQIKTACLQQRKKRNKNKKQHGNICWASTHHNISSIRNTSINLVYKYSQIFSNIMISKHNTHIGFFWNLNLAKCKFVVLRLSCKVYEFQSRIVSCVPSKVWYL